MTVSGTSFDAFLNGTLGQLIVYVEKFEANEDWRNFMLYIEKWRLGSFFAFIFSFLGIIL